MSTATDKKENNRLSDGRVIRALDGTYTQAQMFGLKGKIPAHESIMSVKEHDDALNVSGAWRAIHVNGWWRTSEYAFYPKGFEKRDVPLGDKLVYVEKGVAHILDIPDVPVKLANGQTVGLRQAIGMGVIRLEKLKLEPIDDKTDVVSVTTDFDPATDVKVVDVMRPRAWALVDVDGYTIRSQPSNKSNRDARYSYVRHADEFEGESTGWHGSLARVVIDYYGDFRRNVYAYDDWSKASGVAVEAPQTSEAAEAVPVKSETTEEKADRLSGHLHVSTLLLIDELGKGRVTKEYVVSYVKGLIDTLAKLARLVGQADSRVASMNEFVAEIATKRLPALKFPVDGINDILQYAKHMLAPENLQRKG